MSRLNQFGQPQVPLWDTFEATFFLVAGLFIGVVLGVLFPSIWRNFRRYFRRVDKFAPDSFPIEVGVATPIHTEIGEKPEQYTEIQWFFVLARAVAQQGDIRKSVQLYLQILSHSNVTKEETNQAIFELCQCYALMKLYGRSWDVALELIRRKPKHEPVFDFVMALPLKTAKWKNLESIRNTYTGKLTFKQTLRFCHHFVNAKGMRDPKQGFKSGLKISSHSARIAHGLWQVALNEAVNSLRGDPKAFVGFFLSTMQTLEALSVNQQYWAVYDDLYHLIINLAQVIKGKSVSAGFDTFNSQESSYEPVIYCALLTAVLKMPDLKESFQEIATLLNLTISQSDPQLLTEKIAYLQRQHCQLCQTFHPQFSWQCHHCGALESLVHIKD